MEKHKWYKEIGVWREGQKIEQKWRFGQTWEMVKYDVTPAFNHPDYDIRIYDKHREVKEAMARGELCQWKFFATNSVWIDAHYPLFDYDECWDDREWRITPKPDPYSEFRDAERRGDSVEFHRATGAWERKSVGLAYHLPPELYRIAPKPDPYQHLRDAIREGKKIEFYSGRILGSWISIGAEDDHNPNRSFHLPPDQYRIAPKPDYVVEGAVYFCEGFGFRKSIPVSVTIDGGTNEATSVELVK